MRPTEVKNANNTSGSNSIAATSARLLDELSSNNQGIIATMEEAIALLEKTNERIFQDSEDKGDGNPTTKIESMSMARTLEHQQSTIYGLANTIRTYATRFNSKL